jgi:hypothetical protein
MDGYRRRQLAYKIQKLFSFFFCVICLVLGFAQLSIAETDANTPVYCHQGECLYCDDNGCIVTSDRSSQQYAATSDEAISSTDMNQLVSDLMAQERQPAPVHEPSATPDSMSMDAFVSQINAEQQPPVVPPSKKPSKRTHRPAIQPKRAKSKTTQPMIFYYQSTVDVAQYALHQGNSRSANLIETFIPIGRWTFEKVLFLDARFYNPNGTPVEGNIDLGFRRLFNQGNKLFGIYAGYDRYRSETRRYYNQANAGLEFWLKRFFVGGNVYIPFGTTVYDNDALNVAYLVSTGSSFRYNIAYEQGKERAMPGGDAEIGYDVTPNFTLYGGGYYFDHADAKSIAGPKLRATYTFYRSQANRLLKLFDRIRLEGLVSHDSVRGTSWLLGLRFTFGFGHNFNPTKAVIRHMADPIRRDLNGVSEGFNASAQPYMIDGRRARVDLVSSSSDRTIGEAVSGTADIIGIIGSNDSAGTLTVGDRNLTLTGGRLDFAINGHPYTIEGVGRNGILTYDAVSSNLFDVADTTGDHTLALQYFTIDGADEAGFALQTDGDSFGHIIVKHITANTPFDFTLAGSSDTSGKVTFTNNTLNLTDSEAIDGDVGDFAGVIFLTDADTQQLDVLHFSTNEINVLNRTISDDVSILYVSGTNNTPINFTNGFLNNKIVGMDNDVGTEYSTYTSGISINGDVRGNTFTASGTTDVGASLFVGWGIGSDGAEIDGNVSDNAFIGSDSDNTLFASGYGWRINGDTTISGNVSDNTFTASSNADDGYPWQTTATTMISGNVSGNTFTASDNSDNGYGWYILGTTTISGNVSGNTFIASDNADDVYVWLISADTMISGNVSDNIFTVSGNEGFSIFGWYNGFTSTITTIGGNVSGNMFTVTGSTGGSGVGWFIAHSTTIGGSVSSNTFTTSDSDDDGTGWEISGTTTISGDVSKNTFTVTGNGTGGFGWKVEDSATVTGEVKNNTLQIDDGLTTTNGFDFTAGSGGVVINFEQAIKNNLFLINTNPSGLTGINMDTTGGGTIKLKGNTDGDQLRDVNNKAEIVAAEGGGTICYGSGC